MTLKKMRENVGLTQAELATMSGVNLRSLQDYEQGHKPLSSAKGDTLMRLSTTLGYSVEEILKGSMLEIEDIDSNHAIITQRMMAYECQLNKRRTKMFHFPIIVSDEQIDMSRIYPTKQQEVKRVLELLRPDERVEGLHLFGSSITMACCKDSDIDFAVKLRCEVLQAGNNVPAMIQQARNDVSELIQQARNDVSELIQQSCDWKADIIWLDHLSSDERIYKDIMEGLVLI